MIVLTVANGGNVPIAQGDYEDPLTFEFGGENARVLAAQIVKTVPAGLQAEVTFADRRVTLEKTLLNGGDVLSLKVLVTLFDGTIKPYARILGVREVRKFRATNRVAAVFQVFLLSLAMIGWFVGVILDFPLWGPFAVAVGAYALLGLMFWRTYRRRARMRLGA